MLLLEGERRRRRRLSSLFLRLLRQEMSAAAAFCFGESSSPPSAERGRNEKIRAFETPLYPLGVLWPLGRGKGEEDGGISFDS